MFRKLDPKLKLWNVKDPREMKFHKFKVRLLMMLSEARHDILRIIKYLLITCPSDYYLFHENIVKEYWFKNNPAPLPPR